MKLDTEHRVARCARQQTLRFGVDGGDGQVGVQRKKALGIVSRTLGAEVHVCEVEVAFCVARSNASPTSWAIRSRRRS